MQLPNAPQPGGNGDDYLGTGLLTAASGGDAALLRTLVRTVLGLSQLAEMIQDRSASLPDAQLDALRTYLGACVQPYERVTAELAHRSGAEDERTAPTIGLTQRQRQVLTLLGDGLTAQAIARRLCVSPRTVGKHLERVYRQLGTSDRLSTVLQARRYGLLDRRE